MGYDQSCKSLIEQQLENVKWNGDKASACCPFHNDRNPSLSIWKNESGRWCYKCHSIDCGFAGDLYQLAEKLELDPSPFSLKVQVSNNIPEPVNGNGSLNHHIIDLEAKMEEWCTLGKFKSPSYKGMKIGRYGDYKTIPYFNMDGILTGIKKHKKGGWIGNGKCRLYAQQKLAGFDRDTNLIICEGELDCLELLSEEYQATSGSAGAGSVPHDLSLITSWNAPITILFDNDKAGRLGAVKWCKTLIKDGFKGELFIAKWSNGLPEGYDVRDDLSNDLKEVQYALKNETKYDLPRKGYKVMTGTQLIQKDMQKTESVIEYLMMKNGVSILAGPEGVGKTWAVIQIACSITSGVSVFDDFKVKIQEVMMIQFELPLQSLQERLKSMMPYFNERSPVQNWANNIHLVSLTDEDRLFTDQWGKIEETLKETGFKDGVLIVDNLYTSTDADVSINQELKPILSQCRHLANGYGVSILLVAHFNKGINLYKELHGDIVQGGKQLLMFANNCLLIGPSKLSNQLRIAKIWKCRDEHCPLEHEAFKLHWDEDNLVFHKGEVINNEGVHFQSPAEKWEITHIKELAKYSEKDGYRFDRKQLMAIAEWDETDKNIRKASRFLNRVAKWGYIKKHSQNDYEVIVTDFDDD